jgi:hypothetical protein
MKILVLENDISIQSQFRSAYMGNTVEFATSELQCKALLKYAMWDALFLGCLYTDDSSKVAKWLKDNPMSRPYTIITYVASPMVRSDIKGALPQSMYVPYAYAKNVIGGV